MYSFTVNGKLVETEKEVSLLRFLRDDLKLKSIKDGCSQGACGTCTIIIDGKATRACVMTTKRAQGMNIVTVEGLSDEEKENLYMHSAQRERYSAVFVFREW